MTQTELNFDTPHNGTATSRAAAENQKPSKVKADRAAILAYVKSRDGATRDQIEVGLGMAGNTVRPRVWELIGYGHLEVTTEKRPTRAGSPAFVLRVKK